MSAIPIKDLSTQTLTDAPESGYQMFQKRYPNYATSAKLDQLRRADYDGKRTAGEVYLDYTGGGQFGLSQLSKHIKLLEGSLFGNPHSDNPTSKRSTDLAEKARARVLQFFNAEPSDYDVIFTPNASGALRLVGESYPFSSGARYLALFDNHNSVIGIREYARSKGAKASLVTTKDQELRVGKADVTAALQNHDEKPHLFSFPAQSNFSGVQHSLEFIELAHEQGWDVLLDAAAFVPTNKLDLGLHKPDFVSLSFYKMFGWPTGVGCLIAKKSALAKLQKPWFAGGTIWAASAQGDWHVLAPEHEAFEDGTINYLNLPAITIGLDYLEQADINLVHTRLKCLTGWLLDQMQSLKHSDGRPLITLYGPIDTKDRGGTVAFNVIDQNGQIIDERIVEQAAKKQGISLRTGCFCNPGAGETAFQLDTTKLKQKPDHTKSFDHQLSSLGLPTGGAIRVSAGLFTNYADIEAFLAFVESFKNTSPSAEGWPSRAHC